MPELHTLSHRHDPPTSHAAARRHVASGRAPYHAAIVLNLVRRAPGSTAIELWEHCTADERHDLKEPQEVRRRLTGLLKDGLVRQGLARRCSVRGTGMVTWFTQSA